MSIRTDFCHLVEVLRGLDRFKPIQQNHSKSALHRIAGSEFLKSALFCA